MKWNHGGDWAAFQRECGFLPLDFSANISPLGLAPEIREAAAAALSAADRYPDPHCTELREALSMRFGISPEQVVCGNGAADLIYRLVFLLKPQKALVPVPTFTEYEHALALAECWTEHVFCREEQDFALPEAVTEAITPGTDLVFLCNPNNPTGRLIQPTLLERVVQKCEDVGCVLLVDECFLDFSRECERHSLIGKLSQCCQLIVLRAFTKLYAMPGLRFGYALCGSKSLAGSLSAFGQPWSVSAPAQSAGLAALKLTALEDRTQLMITQERAFLQEELAALELRVIPGEANFLLFFSEEKQLSQKCREKGILIRDCSDFTGLCPGWYRTAVRTRQENLLLLQVLKEVLHGS